MKALVFGTNIEFSHVKALADAGVEVYYYTDYVSNFPTFDDYASGYGFNNIKKIHNPFTMLDKVDKIFTFDVYYGDLFEYLKNEGYDVFGGGSACNLETNRKILKNTLNVLGISSAPYKIVKGYKNVPVPSVVKISYFRGSIETFILNNEQDKDTVRVKLYKEFGDYIDRMEFIVEELVDTSGMMELGIDAFYNEGFVFPMLLGLEYKKGVYVGKVINKLTELPKPMQETVIKLDKVLRKMNYKGMLSTEEFVDLKRNKHYFLDITVRGAYPLSLAYPYWIKNYAKVLTDDETPEYRDKYVVATPFTIEETKNQFVNIDFPEGDKRFGFEALMKIRDRYSVPKQEQSVSGVVCEAFSSYDIARMIRSIDELLSQVKAYSLTNASNDLEEALRMFAQVV